MYFTNSEHNYVRNAYEAFLEHKILNTYFVKYSVLKTYLEQDEVQLFQQGSDWPLVREFNL